ncbi:hypothetical protein F5Y01DRAFT_318261 [Xylaria sp. FL0043]|nr:hypothetical protein F5Y01DRAFT_318261 [Xylaria sp. FL0043]
MGYSSFVADSNNKVTAESLPDSPSYVSRNDSMMDRTKTSYDQADSKDHEDSRDGPEGMIATAQDHGNDYAKPDSFLGLQRSSGNNQMYSLIGELDLYKSEEKKLLRKRAAIDSELEVVRKKQKPIEAQVDERQECMRTERNAAGISDRLWGKYETFCETLQPNGYEERRSFVRNERYNGLYSEYDTKLESLSSAVDGKPGSWRCECVATYTKGGSPIGYQVNYYALKVPKFTTWGCLFPALYDGAVKAAKRGSAAALEMLIALPPQSGRTEHSWAFEFQFEESRNSHPDPSRRWSYRAAHRVRPPSTNQTKRNDLIIEYGLPFKIE